jgi:hypothetical protein
MPCPRANSARDRPHGRRRWAQPAGSSAVRLDRGCLALPPRRCCSARSDTRRCSRERSSARRPCRGSGSPPRRNPSCRSRSRPTRPRRRRMPWRSPCTCPGPRAGLGDRIVTGLKRDACAAGAPVPLVEDEPDRLHLLLRALAESPRMGRSETIRACGSPVPPYSTGSHEDAAAGSIPATCSSSSPPQETRMPAARIAAEAQPRIKRTRRTRRAACPVPAVRFRPASAAARRSKKTTTNEVHSSSDQRAWSPLRTA